MKNNKNNVIIFALLAIMQFFPVNAMEQRINSAPGWLEKRNNSAQRLSSENLDSKYLGLENNMNMDALASMYITPRVQLTPIPIKKVSVISPDDLFYANPEQHPWTVEEFNEICLALEMSNESVLYFLMSIDDRNQTTFLMSDGLSNNRPLIKAVINRVGELGGPDYALGLIVANDKTMSLGQTVLFKHSGAIKQDLIDVVASFFGLKDRNSNVQDFIKIKSNDGSNALHYACGKQDVADVQILLQNFERFGGDVITLLCEKDNYNDTTLTRALSNGSIEKIRSIVKLLLGTASRIGGPVAVRKIINDSNSNFSALLSCYDDRELNDLICDYDAKYFYSKIRDHQ